MVISFIAIAVFRSPVNAYAMDSGSPSLPEIDINVPDEFETATFALG